MPYSFEIASVGSPDADVEVDAVIFEAEAHAALKARDASACQRAAAHYAGELLPDDR